MPTRVTPQELFMVHASTFKGNELVEVSERKKVVETQLRIPGAQIADLRFQLEMINQEHEEKHLAVLSDILLYLKHMVYTAFGIPAHSPHERIPIHPSQWKELRIDFDHGAAEGCGVSYSSLVFFISLEEAEQASFLALADEAQGVEIPPLPDNRMTLCKFHKGGLKAYYEYESRKPQSEPKYAPSDAEAAMAMWDGVIRDLREEDRAAQEAITSLAGVTPIGPAPAAYPEEPAPYATGGAGRPSMMHLIKAEMERRAKDGEIETSVSQESKKLAAWAKTIHPTGPITTAGTIENSLREFYKSVKKTYPPK